MPRKKPTPPPEPVTMQAEHSQSRSDLFWRVYDWQLDGSGDGAVRWSGYDDRYWWENVAPTAKFQRQVGKSGRAYTLDPSTGVVTVTAPTPEGA